MGRDPDDAAIANFVAFTGADQHEAIEFLTRESDVEKAVQNYFEAQDRGTSAFSTYVSGDAWNESDMHAGKEYGPETNPQTTYKIHSVDNVQTLGPDIFDNTVSRPPSRVDGKPNFKEELQYETSTTTFGPATREHYPASQWGMVTTSHHILPDPEPKQRARMPSAPTFVKPTTKDNKLPSLLVIYQQIPLACEALLVRDHVRAEYGTSKDWWQGDPIRSRGVVVSVDGNQSAGTQTPVIDEMQRLMAFLELTERAYGSSDTLLDAIHHSRHRPWMENAPADAHFFPTWIEECKEALSNENLRDIFSTTAFERLNGEEINKQSFQVFALTLEYDLDGKPSLYDLIDEVMWAQWVLDSPAEMTLKPGHVLTFQFGQTSSRRENSTKLIDWPLVWYADRYLEENKEKALHMLHEQARIEEERNTLQMQQSKLEQVTSSATRKSIAAIDLLKVVKPYLDGEKAPVDELDRRDEIIASGAKYHPLDEYRKIGEELQAFADEILRKHEALEQAKSQLTSRKKIVTDFLKGSSNSPEDKPTHRYTLRGASTDMHTTYVLANPNTSEDLLETDDWDWWMIRWDTQSDNPADLRKVEEADILEAVRKAEVVTTVYASDAAVKCSRQAVPPPLKNFVRADNLHFSSELENPEINRTPEDRNWDYVQGRGYNYNSHSRNSSPDSMAANMDTDMNQWDSHNDETHPPSYSSTPPPIPPRTGEKRRASLRLSIEDDNEPLAGEVNNIQEYGTVNVMDDDTQYDQEMVEINSPSSAFGATPGQPKSVSNTEQGN